VVGEFQIILRVYFLFSQVILVSHPVLLLEKGSEYHSGPVVVNSRLHDIFCDESLYDVKLVSFCTEHYSPDSVFDD